MNEIRDGIVSAAESDRVYSVAVKTPLQPMPFISEQLGCRVLMKREDMQPVFSFKNRGAANRVGLLAEQGSNSGVAAASAGNHAQGVAISARRLGIPALIVMPRTTPDVKVRAVRQLGAEVALVGDTYEQASQAMYEMAQQRGYTTVHPFDEDDVICGQGTVAYEMLQQHPDPLDAVFIPVGGGGLIAGMAAHIKAVRPEIEVIGVEPEDSACAQAALRAGERVVLREVGLFTDGVAVRQVGERTFPLIQQHCDDIITVSIDELCAAVRDLYEEFRVLAEPAGALALAGIRKWCEGGQSNQVLANQVLAGVLSGANTNFERIGHIVERAGYSAHRELLLGVRIPEKPGSFLQLCRDLGDVDISEFNYRYADDEQAQVFIGVRGGEGVDEKLEQKQYEYANLSDNEVAKTHLRYMIGGRGQPQSDELVYSVMFPERPGALLRFLEILGSRWNITLFHYRNHGSAYGRVLIGFNLGKSDASQLEAKLKDIGYRFQNESDNAAYRAFLS